MSVINQMLQGLEARQAGTGAAPEAVRAPPVAPARRRLPVWLLGGAAALAGVAFGDWPALLPANAARLPQPVTIAGIEPVAADAAVVGGGAIVSAPASAPAPVSAPVAVPASTPPPRPRARALPAPTPAPTDGPAAATTPTSIPVATLAATSAAMPATPAAPLRTAEGRPDSRPQPAIPAAIGKGLQVAKVEYGLVPGLSAPPAQAASTPAPSASAAAAMPALAMPARADPTVPGRVDKQMAAQSPAQRAQLLYRQGLELAGTGHGRTAVERLQEALALDPSLKAARLQTVTLLFEQGRSAEAEALARDGLALSPDEAQLAYLLARGMAGHGDAAGAIAVLARSPRLSADAFGLRAGLLSQEGDFKRALPDYEQAVRLQPGNSLWWLGLGVALEAEGQRQQARQVYARAQGIGVNSHELNVFLDQKLQALKP